MMFTVAYKVDKYIEIEFCANKSELLNLICSMLYDNDDIDDLNTAFSELEATMEDSPDFSMTVVNSRGREIFKM